MFLLLRVLGAVTLTLVDTVVDGVAEVVVVMLDVVVSVAEIFTLLLLVTLPVAVAV